MVSVSHTPAAYVVSVIPSPSRGCDDCQGLSWSCLHKCVCLCVDGNCLYLQMSALFQGVCICLSVEQQWCMFYVNTEYLYVCVCVCGAGGVGQTVGIIGLAAPTVKGVTESTGVCS